MLTKCPTHRGLEDRKRIFSPNNYNDTNNTKKIRNFRFSILLLGLIVLRVTLSCNHATVKNITTVILLSLRSGTVSWIKRIFYTMSFPLPLITFNQNFIIMG